MGAASWKSGRMVFPSALQEDEVKTATRRMLASRSPMIPQVPPLPQPRAQKNIFSSFPTRAEAYFSAHG